MPEREAPEEEPLLERLRQTASGEESLRQLRRRYNALRDDYDQLLGRLEDLEGRLAGATPGPGSLSAGLTADLLAPLLHLRDDYQSAAQLVQTLATGLEQLTAGLIAEFSPAPPPPAAPPPGPGGTMRVEVRGSGFGELLDFQERLSELDGVSRVSIHAIDTDRATFVVELGAGRQRDDG